MNNLKLNIGLNNSTTDYFGTISLLDVVYNSSYWQTTYKVLEYNNKPEPTAVTDGDTKSSLKIVTKAVELFCKLLTQECIAIKYNGKGLLVYHPEYVGERQEFSDKYFSSL